MLGSFRKAMCEWAWRGFVFIAGSAGHFKALKRIYNLDCPGITQAYAKVGYVNAWSIACALSFTNAFLGDPEYDIIATYQTLISYVCTYCVPALCRH